MRSRCAVIHYMDKSGDNVRKWHVSCTGMKYAGYSHELSWPGISTQVQQGVAAFAYPPRGAMFQMFHVKH